MKRQLSGGSSSRNYPSNRTFGIADRDCPVTASGVERAFGSRAVNCAFLLAWQSTIGAFLGQPQPAQCATKGTSTTRAPPVKPFPLVEAHHCNREKDRDETCRKQEKLHGPS